MVKQILYIFTRVSIDTGQIQISTVGYASIYGQRSDEKLDSTPCVDIDTSQMTFCTFFHVSVFTRVKLHFLQCSTCQYTHVWNANFSVFPVSIGARVKWKFVQFPTCQYAHVYNKSSCGVLRLIMETCKMKIIQYAPCPNGHVALEHLYSSTTCHCGHVLDKKYNEHATCKYGDIYDEILYGVPRVNMPMCSMTVCTVFYVSIRAPVGWNLVLYPRASMDTCQAKICTVRTCVEIDTFRMKIYETCHM